MVGYTQYAVYWRNPENRQYERIPIVQLVKSPSGALRVQMHIERKGKWHTISKLWRRK